MDIDLTTEISKENVVITTGRIIESAKEFLSVLEESRLYLDDRIDELEKSVESINNKILQIS